MGEPPGSPSWIRTGKPMAHLPPTPAEIDEIVAVPSDGAVAMARRAARVDGVWSGPSTGASITAAVATPAAMAAAAPAAKARARRPLRRWKAPGFSTRI